MREHPIEGLMLTAMENIRSMIDISTIIGDAISISEDITIIPVSKVSFGLAAGGSEFKDEALEQYLKKHDDKDEIQYRFPFGGGTGVGASVAPIAFIVIQENSVKLMPVEHSNGLDKVLDYLPDIINKLDKKMNRNNKIKENGGI